LLFKSGVFLLLLIGRGRIVMKWFYRLFAIAFVTGIPLFWACSDADKSGQMNGIVPGKGAAVKGGVGEGGVTMKNKPDQVVRVAKGSGRWFPGDGVQLATMVGDFIKHAKVSEIKGRIVAAIAPHAGYVYSGRVAGSTFRAIQDNAIVVKRPETVVILGFHHRRGFRGVALMDGDELVTPLGAAKIDMDTVRMLASSPGKKLFIDYSLHGEEHSAENEVPFVQVTLPGVKIVVGLFGDHDGETLDAVVAALAELAKKKRILVIASTDMLHDADYDLVSRTDKDTMKKLACMDIDGLVRTWNMEKQIFCGLMPVLAVMKFSQLQGCGKATILEYRNSGDDYPESRGNWVVGYGSAAFVVQE